MIPLPPLPIQEAARASSIHDEIVAMPMGYETMVGDMGSALSGGQKQHLLLARALSISSTKDSGARRSNQSFGHP
jgi:ABC-type bacteriocin/lantibiotic exporter with double-glycine peptidase domain